MIVKDSSTGFLQVESNDVVCVLVASGLDRAAEGLIGAGQRLAGTLGGKLRILALANQSERDIEQLTRYGDQVVIVRSADMEAGLPEACLAGLESALRESNPAAILFGNDTLSQELPARLAHRLGGSAVGDAQEGSVHDGKIRVARSVYGGKAMAIVELQKTPAVIWMRAHAQTPAEPKASRVGLVTIEPQLGTYAKTALKECHVEPCEGVRLEDATVIVSGGRGLGGAEQFAHLKQLADVMNAQMAASRAACDSGWVPHSWQVGQTGKKVAPELYLAVALSGSSQHLMGIADAKAIVAINIDSNAPIFKHCQFGIVEDYRNVIGPLQEKLAAKLA